MFWTPIILGFAGSLHCLGMCSPLAVAVTSRSSKVITARVLYNFGRILTYGISGSIVASVGFALPLGKYQNVLSIAAGVMLLVIGVTGVSGFKIPFVTKGLERWSIFLKKQFSTFLTKRNNASTFILGSLNGILPCGLSYVALTYCLTLAGPIDGFNFMFLFGMGTLPVMAGFTSIFHWVIKRFSLSMRKLTTGLLVVSGLLLIGRVFYAHAAHSHGIAKGSVDVVVCR